MDIIKHKYVQFPLHLIRGLFTDKVNTINKILEFGIYHFAMKLKYDMDNVFRQLIYLSLHKKDQVTPELLMKIENNPSFFSLDDIDCGGYNFNNEFDIYQGDFYSEARDYFDNNTTIQNLAIEHYLLNNAMYLLEINSNVGLHLLNRRNQSNPTGILPMVRLDKLFEYRDSDKSEQHLVEFVAYIALRSILGKKNYCKTNKAHMFARMFGFSSIKDIKFSKLNKTQIRIFNHYQERYQFSILMESLDINWNLKYYSYHTRGFYVGKGISKDELVLIAEKKRPSNKKSKLKNENEAARKKALSTLFKP